MKKKVLALLLALILILTLGVGVLSGCSLFERNAQRELDQVVVTIGEGDTVDKITLRDLYTMYSTLNLSENDYESVGEVMEILVKEYTNRYLIIHEGLNELPKINVGGKDVILKGEAGYDESHRYDVYFSDEELEIITKAVEYQIAAAINSYYASILEESSTESIAEITLRTVPSWFSENINYIPDYVAIDDLQDPIRNKAYKRLIKTLAENSISFDTYYNNLMKSEKEARFFDKYITYIQNEFDLSEAQMNAKYENILATQKEMVALNSASYETYLSESADSSYVLYNPYEGYGYVTNLLIPFTGVFSTAASSAYSSYTSGSSTFVEYQTLLGSYLNQLKAEDQRTTWLQYYGYDTSEDGLFGTTPFDGVLVKKMEYGAHAFNSKGYYLYEEITPNRYFIDEFMANVVNVKLQPTSIKSIVAGKNNMPLSIYQTDIAKASVFEELMWVYGTDTGMMNRTMDYVSAPEKETETYVEEFAVAARAVVDAGEGAYTVVGTRYGYHIVFCTKKINVGVTNEYVHSEKDTEGTFSYDFYQAALKEAQDSYLTERQNNIIVKYRAKSGYIKINSDAYNQALSL